MGTLDGYREENKDLRNSTSAAIKKKDAKIPAIRATSPMATAPIPPTR
jgi:hypothetical protein